MVGQNFGLSASLFSYAAERLSYDPATGEITWTKPGRHVKAGDLAGTIAKDGHVVVSLRGEKIKGPYLAWALHHGGWPEHDVGLRSDTDWMLSKAERIRERENLSFDNLVVRARGERVDVDPRSVYRRELRARTKHLNREMEIRAALDRMASEFPNITWDKDKDEFMVHDKPQWVRDNPMIPTNRVFFRSPDWTAAEQASLDMEHNLRLLLEAPHPDDTHPFARSVASVRPNEGLSYLTLRHFYLYDPVSGQFIWASGPRIGHRADTATSYGRFRRVECRGYVLEAHRLAWFMSTGIWPKPRTIHHVDGDTTNNRIENLKHEDNREFT